jgi:hypothetical protein
MLLRSSRFGLAVTLVVIAFGCLLVAFGLQGLLRSPSATDIILLAVGVYALWQAVKTPYGLRVEDGRLSLVGLFPRSVPMAELARVQLVRGGFRRNLNYRFLRGDGSMAFAADATLWRASDVEKLIGLPVE